MLTKPDLNSESFDTGLRAATLTKGTNDEIPCFGQESEMSWKMSQGETQQPLPLCFGSPSTSRVQVKLT